MIPDCPTRLPAAVPVKQPWRIWVFISQINHVNTTKEGTTKTCVFFMGCPVRCCWFPGAKWVKMFPGYQSYFHLNLWSMVNKIVCIYQGIYGRIEIPFITAYSQLPPLYHVYKWKGKHNCRWLLMLYTIGIMIDPCGAKGGDFQEREFNTIAVDALAPCVASSSAGMVLNYKKYQGYFSVKMWRVGNMK